MFKQEGIVFHYKGNFVIDGISKVQGITIYNEYMLVYTSYGRYNKSKMYVFKDSVNKFRKNNIVYNKNGNKKIREIRLPNMMESCCLEDKKFYFITESASRCYRKGKGFMNIILRPYDKYVVYDNIFKV